MISIRKRLKIVSGPFYCFKHKKVDEKYTDISIGVSVEDAAYKKCEGHNGKCE